MQYRIHCLTVPVAHNLLHFKWKQNGGPAVESEQHTFCIQLWQATVHAH